MKKIFLLGLVVLSSCKGKYVPSPVETCIHNKDNSAQCTDLRLPKEQQDYKRTNLENYWCTGPNDQLSLYNYAQDLRKKLIACESRSQNSY